MIPNLAALAISMSFAGKRIRVVVAFGGVLDDRAGSSAATGRWVACAAAFASFL